MWWQRQQRLKASFQKKTRDGGFFYWDCALSKEIRYVHFLAFPVMEIENMQKTFMQPTMLQKLVILANGSPLEFNPYFADLMDRQNYGVSALEQAMRGTAGATILPRMAPILKGESLWTDDVMTRALLVLGQTAASAICFPRKKVLFRPKTERRKILDLAKPRRAYAGDWESVKAEIIMQPNFAEAVQMMNATILSYHSGGRQLERKRIGALLLEWLDDRLVWPQELSNAMVHYREIKYQNQFVQLRRYGVGDWKEGRVAVLLWRTGWTPEMLIGMVNGLKPADMLTMQALELAA
jgi:hypothetical protein